MVRNPGKDRWGVALLNMGGPQTADEVHDFLRDLLSDPAVMGIPFGPLRRLIARRIAKKRTPEAIARYGEIGGGSPLTLQTEAQARALKTALGDAVAAVTVAMRYTRPGAEDALAQLLAAGVTRTVVLPLYPQSAKATTGSSLLDWKTKAAVMNMPSYYVSAYPELPGFIAAMAAPMLKMVAAATNPVVLFAAHGLPERAAKRDDYPEHVARTAAALAATLPAGIEHRTVFQSRLGPVKWMQPYLDETVIELGAAGVKAVVVVPISFVSEHIETLHELDIELKQIAEQADIADFRRVPTVQTAPKFIDGLAGLVRETIAKVEQGGVI